MLKAKKRPADKTSASDEPNKKKSPNAKKPNGKSTQFEKKKTVKFAAAKNTVKTIPAAVKTEDGEKKFVAKPNAKSFNGKPKSFNGKPKSFNGKPAQKWTGKPGGPQAGAKKFTGKPQHGDKKFEGKPHLASNKFSGKPTVDGAAAATEKTDWNKFKQDRKELKLKRKKTKDVYEISVEAKQIYEKLKCRRTEKKSELVEKLYNLFSGGDTLKKIIMAHDTARILQCMVKFATPALRDQLSEKLLPFAVEMSVSKYSHFCVLRMFKYGSPTIKSKMVDMFQGNVVRLACHSISSKILDHVYLSVASAQQKAHMRQEFYGDLYKKSKDAGVKCLADTYKNTPEMKASILSAVKANLEHVANKQLVDNSLVHAVMLEYLRECEEDKLEEAVTMYATLIPLMLTTKDGCQAGVLTFYKSTPKNRRAIIKAIKEHLVKICTHEHGHIFMLAVLNALDDTKATKKAIYDNIHPELNTLVANKWGRRVIEWFISPGDTNGFHPAFISVMDEALEYGKKDKELRRKEIFEQIEEPIAKAIAENAEFWFTDKHVGLVTAIILKKLSAVNFVAASSALAPVIANPQWLVQVEDDSKEKKQQKPQDVEKIIADATKVKKQKKKQKANKEKSEENDEDDDADEKQAEEVATKSVPGIEEAGMHIVLKKILKADKLRSEQGETQTFGSLLVENLTDETLLYWITVNRACFVLLNVAENNSAAVCEALKKLLVPHKTLLLQQSSSGSKLLAKKLAL